LAPMVLPSRRDLRLDEVIHYLSERMAPIPLNDTHKMRRVYAKHILDWAEKEYPQTDPMIVAKRLINIATKDEWHRRNAMSVGYIYRQRGKLVMLGLEEKEKKRQKRGGSGYRVEFD